MTLSHILIPGISGLALVVSVGILKDPMSRSFDHGVAQVDALTFDEALDWGPNPPMNPQLLMDVSAPQETVALRGAPERQNAFISMRGKVMALIKGQKRMHDDGPVSISPAQDDGYLPGDDDFGAQALPEDTIGLWSPPERFEDGGAGRLSPAMASTPLHLRVAQGQDAIEVSILSP